MTVSVPRLARSVLIALAVIGPMAGAGLTVPERASAAAFQRCTAGLPTFGLRTKNVTCARGRAFARARRSDDTSGTYGVFQCRASTSSNVRSWGCTHRASRRAIVWAERLEDEDEEEAEPREAANCGGIDAPPVYLLRSTRVPCPAGLRIARRIGGATEGRTTEGLTCAVDVGVGMQEGDRSWSCDDAAAGGNRFLTWIYRPA